MQQTCIHGDASLFSFWFIINDFNGGITLYRFLHITNKTCFKFTLIISYRIRLKWKNKKAWSGIHFIWNNFVWCLHARCNKSSMMKLTFLKHLSDLILFDLGLFLHHIILIRHIICSLGTSSVSIFGKAFLDIDR